jgi:hypothetical protein
MPGFPSPMSHRRSSLHLHTLPRDSSILFLPLPFLQFRQHSHELPIISQHRIVLLAHFIESRRTIRIVICILAQCPSFHAGILVHVVKLLQDKPFCSAFLYIKTFLPQLVKLASSTLSLYNTLGKQRKRLLIILHLQPFYDLITNESLKITDYCI